MAAQTFSPDPPTLGQGAGYANYQAGGWGPVALQKATGANAGTPGGFTPAPCYIPEDLADMADVTASPATPWTTAQRVVTFDGQECYWNGSAWSAGRAALAAKATTAKAE